VASSKAGLEGNGWESSGVEGMVVNRGGGIYEGISEARISMQVRACFGRDLTWIRKDIPEGMATWKPW